MHKPNSVLVLDLCLALINSADETINQVCCTITMTDHPNLDPFGPTPPSIQTQQSGNRAMGNTDGSTAHRRGRPPKQAVAMSSAERSRKHREKVHRKKLEEAKNRRLPKQAVAMSSAERTRKHREKVHPKKLDETTILNKLRMREARSSLTFDEKAQINAKRREVREERTPEEAEEEKTEQMARMTGLRQTRRAVKSAQSGKFDATEVWEVPGRDFLFDRFQDDPQSSVLLWYANNGSWWEREPKMCIAWLRFYNELDRELKLKASAGAADADVTKQHEELCGLSVFKDEAGVVVRSYC